MASVIAKLPPPPLFVNGRLPLLMAPQRISVSPFGERRHQVAMIAKATSDSSESTSSTSLVKSVQNIWDKSEDRVAVIGLGFAGVIALWASANLVGAIDKLPVVPGVLELVGILFSSWFIYRYLLFKPDREELFQAIDKSISQILGQ